MKISLYKILKLARKENVLYNKYYGRASNKEDFYYVYNNYRWQKKLSFFLMQITPMSFVPIPNYLA